MRTIAFLLLTTFLIGHLACSDDDPEVVTETITVRDTIVVVEYDTTIIVEHDTTVIIVNDTTVITQIDTIIEMLNDDSTLVAFCVRHAETIPGGGNPPLSAAGQQRAMDLSQALSNIDLDHVYSSSFNRTRETAQTTAQDQNLPVEIYNAFDMPGFARQLIENNKGERVLVVGHSNTTPELLNELTMTNDYVQFNENTYDNLFIVSVRIDGTATVFHLEYGMDSP